MFLITLADQEKEGAYAATDEFGNQILYIFEEEDDAARFAMLLEEEGYPEMDVTEVEHELIVKACEVHEYDYKIFTSDDIVVPPQEDTDFI